MRMKIVYDGWNEMVQVFFSRPNWVRVPVNAFRTWSNAKKEKKYEANEADVLCCVFGNFTMYSWVSLKLRFERQDVWKMV